VTVFDVVVVGAGMVGAACAHALADAGLRVCVIDRSGPAAGTTAGGEGNILVSDKVPGPEARLALHSVALWRSLAERAGAAAAGPGRSSAAAAGPGRSSAAAAGPGQSSAAAAGPGRSSAAAAGPGRSSAAAAGPGRSSAAAAGPSRSNTAFEFEPKGGLVVARDGSQLVALRSLADAQAGCGIDCSYLDASGLRELEPLLAPDLAGGVWYPQDCQVQPVLAAAWLLAEASRLGAQMRWGEEMIGFSRATVTTSQGRISAGAVVNAAGPWSGEVAARLGGWLPVRPRRGHVLVTEPLPPLVRHKVYEADYVGTVVSDSDAAQTSAVVEGTKAGTVLIGSSREFAGWDRRPSLRVMSAMAARACALFPGLAGVRAMRCYVGFRPASPDHLPLIGPDPEVDGLFHASGHEGAGIGLAPATAALVTALITGAEPPADAASFAPARLAGRPLGRHQAAQTGGRERQRAAERSEALAPGQGGMGGWLPSQGGSGGMGPPGRRLGVTGGSSPGGNTGRPPGANTESA
jgi:glycine/D-amino acid oxidase-like deaminating enzyme